MNEHDQRIDDELRCAFAPPSTDRFADVAAEAAQPEPAGRPVWFVLAAAALLMMAWSTDFWRVQTVPSDPKAAGMVLAAAFDDAVENGFGVGGCCTTATDFPAQCKELCGRALSFAGADDVELLGCYCGRAIPNCIGLLLQVHGDPVAVFVMPKAKDPRPVVADRDDLRLDRRELGPIVLYSLAFDRRAEALASFSL